jgi:hypothetical protein
MVAYSILVAPRYIIKYVECEPSPDWIKRGGGWRRMEERREPLKNFVKYNQLNVRRRLRIDVLQSGMYTELKKASSLP